MIVLHAGIDSKRLLLWGETSDSRKSNGTLSAAADRATDEERKYSFDLGSKWLIDIIKGAPWSLQPDRKRLDQMAAWLPTRGNKPIPSPLIADGSYSRGKPKLTPWLVTTYELRADEIIDLLCCCVQKKTIVPGVVIGDDLAFWSEALRFAGGLVATQRYLPQVIMEDEEFHAKWKPMFSAEDSERLNGLANRMPPVARSLTSPGSTNPPQVNKLNELKRFLSDTLDYLVRVSNPSRFASARKSGNKSFDSVHDAWLHSLQSPNSLIHGEANELRRLWTQVRDWNRPIAIAELSPFRLCFRLEEPTPAETMPKNRRIIPDEKWRVHYLIQSCADPSLIVPARDAWKPKPKMLSALKTNPSDLREYLLLSLGQAGSICSNIEKSLKSTQPDGYTLDTVEAHEFLTEKAVLLKHSGFTVMFPGWWTRSGTKEGLSLRATVRSPKLKASSGLSLGAIVDFDWEVALGGVKLSLPELKALAKLKSPLVQLRGQWVEVNVEEIQAAVDSWKKKELSKTTVGDLIKMAVGAKDSPLGFEFGGVTATGWVGNLLQQLEGNSPLDQLSPADTFNGTLRPYQTTRFFLARFFGQIGNGRMPR